MKIVFNTNDYIGGGETFVFEFLKLNPEYKIVCVKDSWLAGAVGNDRILYFHRPSKFNLLSRINQWIFKRVVSRNKVKITRVLFLNFQDFLTYHSSFNKDVIIDYYCLHPFDFYYRSAKSWLSLIFETITKTRAPVYGKRALVNYYLVNNYVNGTLFYMDEINRQIHNDHILVQTRVLALPCVEKKEIIIEKKPGKRVLWIGRIVDFKMTALNSIVNFVDENPSYTLTVVGEGDYSNRIVKYKSRNRISFIGKIDYRELQQIIENHDIGFGMGVSSVLMASFSLPTIVGVTDYPNWNVKSEGKCFGLIHELGYGDFGSGIYQSDPMLKSISTVMEHIESNYSLSSKLSYQKSTEFNIQNAKDFTINL